jgi:hypothetical protein
LLVGFYVVTMRSTSRQRAANMLEVGGKARGWNDGIMEKWKNGYGIR